MAFLKKHFALAILPCLIVGVLLQALAESMTVRLVMGAMVACSYLFLSYLVMPVVYRVFFVRNLNQLLKPTGVVITATG